MRQRLTQFLASRKQISIGFVDDVNTAEITPLWRLPFGDKNHYQ